MSRILVTGATGFLGGRVARRLCAHGHDVRMTARPTSSLVRVAGLPVEIVPGDVTDAEALRRAAEGVDVVVHAAAHLEFGPPDPSFMRAVNVGGTVNALEAAARADARAIVVSSVAAYGHTDGAVGDEEWWADEPAAVAYEQTKRDAHVAARRYAQDGGVTIVAPGGIYGYGDAGDFDSLVRAFAYLPLPVSYLPDVTQSFVHVDDCAEAICTLARDRGPSDEYVLCAETREIHGLVGLIVEAAGRKPPRFVLRGAQIRPWLSSADRLAVLFGLNPGQVREIGTVATRSMAFDGARARRELGWAPRPLAAGIREYVHHLLLERDARRAVGLGPAL